MGEMRPKTEGILESSLYVDDVARSARFCERIFGFRVISDFVRRGKLFARFMTPSQAA